MFILSAKKKGLHEIFVFLISLLVVVFSPFAVKVANSPKNFGLGFPIPFVKIDPFTINGLSIDPITGFRYDVPQYPFHFTFCKNSPLTTNFVIFILDIAILFLCFEFVFKIAGKLWNLRNKKYKNVILLIVVYITVVVVLPIVFDNIRNGYFYFITTIIAAIVFGQSLRKRMVKFVFYLALPFVLMVSGALMPIKIYNRYDFFMCQHVWCAGFPFSFILLKSGLSLPSQFPLIIHPLVSHINVVWYLAEIFTVILIFLFIFIWLADITSLHR